MARIHRQRKRDAERRFPHRVDVPVPESGIGSRLNEMLAWCRANIGFGGWGSHGHTEKQPGQVAVDYARFYFMSEADADLFRWQWQPESLARQRRW